MAKFFTDFSEYTADQQPSDWTERWDTDGGAAVVRDSGIPGTPSTGGSHALEVTNSADNWYALSWDEVGTPSGDVQVLVLCYYEHTQAFSETVMTILHGSGVETGEDAYSSELAASSNDLRLAKLVNGGYSILDDSNEGFEHNQWIWFRLDRSSNTIRVRAWLDGNSEPGTWTASATDSAHSSGWVGLGQLNTNGSSWFAQIGVGTGGDAAPSEAVVGIDSVTPSEFADGDTGVTIAGSGFEASQGTGKVELGDSSDYATATLVEQTVTSWSDTSIDFTVVQGALSAGTVYVFVTNDSGSTTDPGTSATLVTNATWNAAKMTATAGMPAASVSGGSQVAAKPMKATGAMPVATVGEVQVMEAGKMAATASMPVATVLGGALVAAAKMAATALMPVAEVSSSYEAAAAKMVASSAMPTARITSSYELTAKPMKATAAMLAFSLALGSVFEAEPMTATARMPVVSEIRIGGRVGTPQEATARYNQPGSGSSRFGRPQQGA